MVKLSISIIYYIYEEEELNNKSHTLLLQGKKYMSDIEKSVVKFNEMYKRLTEQDKDLVSSNLYKKTRSIDREIKFTSMYQRKLVIY